MRNRRRVPRVYDPIVVTATRDAQRAFDVPASVDVIDGAIIRSGQPAISLSESLVRVPGVFAANRQNLRAGPADQLARVRARARPSACAACGSIRTISR